MHRNLCLTFNTWRCASVCRFCLLTGSNTWTLFCLISLNCLLIKLVSVRKSEQASAHLLYRAKWKNIPRLCWLLWRWCHVVFGCESVWAPRGKHEPVLHELPWFHRLCSSAVRAEAFYWPETWGVGQAVIYPQCSAAVWRKLLLKRDRAVLTATSAGHNPQCLSVWRLRFGIKVKSPFRKWRQFLSF